MIEVLSPVGERRKVALRRSAPLPSLEGKVAGLLDNRKSNTGDFLQWVAEDLRALHGVREVILCRKPTAGSASGPETWERLRGCDFFITAFAD